MILEERGNSSDYADKYKWIRPLCESSNPDDVSQIEAHLISTFKNCARCDNRKGGAASL